MQKIYKVISSRLILSNSQELGMKRVTTPEEGDLVIVQPRQGEPINVVYGDDAALNFSGALDFCDLLTVSIDGGHTVFQLRQTQEPNLAVLVDLGPLCKLPETSVRCSGARARPGWKTVDGEIDN